MFDYRSNQCNAKNIFALGSLIMLWHCWIIVIFKLQRQHSAHDIPICNMILLTWWCWLDVLLWIRICNNLWSKVILIQLRQHSAHDIPCRTTRGDPICNMILLTWWCWLAGWMSPSTLLINHWYHIIGFTPPFYAHCIASKPNAVHFLHHLIVIFIIIAKCTPKLVYEGNSCGIISIWKLYSALPW